MHDVTSGSWEKSFTDPRETAKLMKKKKFFLSEKKFLKDKICI